MAEETPLNPEEEVSEQSAEGSMLGAIWNSVRQMGIENPVMRILTPVLLLGLVVVVVLAMRSFVRSVQADNAANLEATAEAMAVPTLEAVTGQSANLLPVPEMPEYTLPDEMISDSIPRFIDTETTIPSRPRVEVTTYEVQQGDNLFGIADNFGLRPETILWGNFELLNDNPQYLSPGQVLNILPTDGTYYRYNVGESLQSIADFFGVAPEAIVSWPGNKLDPYETDIENPGINDGTWLIVPGGQRELRDWGPPAITRANPASAAYYGAGHCGQVYEGPIGTGTFVWPTTQTSLSGYDWAPPIHNGIDIGGAEGNAIYAMDSGVVVYAGWSDFGFGYLIVLDHGNGFQSAYAHLSGVGVRCGQGVAQGTVIGALGNTGNSSGSHLHLEIVQNGTKVNPWWFVAP